MPIMGEVLCYRQGCMMIVQDDREHILPNGEIVYVCDFHHTWFPDDRLIPGAFLEAVL